MNPFIALLLVALTGLIGTADSQAGVPDQEKYANVFSSTLTRVNEVFKSQHLPVLEYDPAQLSFTSLPDLTWRSTLVHVKSSSGIQMDILPGSLEVVSFQRNFPPEEYIDYDTPRKPAWTADQTVSHAQQWVKSLRGNVPENIGKPKVEYTADTNLPKYREGTWTVCWPRIDNQGHLFTQDALNVILSEKFGLIAFAYIFGSKYDDGQKALVSRDQALEIGRAAAQKMLQSPLAAQWSTGLTLTDKANAQLWIVNPNHILDYKTLEDMVALRGDDTARLAWIVDYRASNANHMGRDVEVWIDAENKEILGGDFK